MNLIIQLSLAVLIAAMVVLAMKAQDDFGLTASALAVLMAAGWLALLNALFFFSPDKKKGRRGGAEISSRAQRRITPMHPTSDIEVIYATDTHTDKHRFIDALSGLPKHQPVAMTLRLRPKAEFNRDDLLLQASRVEQQAPAYPYVHVVDQRNGFLGFTTLRDFQVALDGMDARHILDLLNAGRVDELAQAYGFLNRHWVFDKASNLDALQAMANEKTNAVMIVRPSSKRVVGVVDWQSALVRVFGDQPRRRKKNVIDANFGGDD